jgi:beta-glucosidase
VLFPFGYGLSYTTFAYSDLKVKSGSTPHVSFTVANTGQRAGAEIAEVYAALPASTNEPPKRLVGWSKVHLAPGEKKTGEVDVDPLYLSIFDTGRNAMEVAPGEYGFMVGPSSRELPLKETVSLK